ncbi:MAG: hypothetical protein LBI69_05090, partial [Puniceicoccales bacterium]|nr:hypothetical protein [Puniceicoccales bacterium]
DAPPVGDPAIGNIFQLSMHKYLICRQKAFYHRKWAKMIGQPWAMEFNAFSKVLRLRYLGTP